MNPNATLCVLLLIVYAAQGGKRQSQMLFFVYYYVSYIVYWVFVWQFYIIIQSHGLQRLITIVDLIPIVIISGADFSSTEVEI